MSEKTTMEKFEDSSVKPKTASSPSEKQSHRNPKEMVDVTKLSSKRTQVTSEIDSCYRELGMIVYQQRSVGTDAEALFARIAECQKKIQELTAQIEAAKSKQTGLGRLFRQKPRPNGRGFCFL